MMLVRLSQLPLAAKERRFLVLLIASEKPILILSLRKVETHSSSPTLLDAPMKTKCSTGLFSAATLHPSEYTRFRATHTSPTGKSSTARRPLDFSADYTLMGITRSSAQTVD